MIEAPDDTASDILELQEFRQRLALLQRHGVICSVEQAILERLYDGEQLSDLAAEALVETRLRERGIKFPQFIADLQRRIENWQIPEGAHNG